MPAIRKTPSELRAEKDRKKLYRPYKKPVNKKLEAEQINCRKRLTYANFLKTKYWQKVRKAVFKRDKSQCVICKSTFDLEAHHDSYKNHGNELNHLEDLMTLCRECHKEHHYAQN